jgi:type IV pilus assembly protein PilN
MPRINLLPWRAAERKRRQQQFAVWTLMAVGAALVVTGLVWFSVGQAIDAQRDRNAMLKNEIQELDKQIVEIQGLEARRAAMRARMEVIEKLQRSRPEVVHMFDQLVKTMPDGVYLTAVKQTDKRLELKGVAQSSTRVSALMRNIDDSEWMENPDLEVVETKKGQALGSDFTLFATQVGVKLPGEEEEPQP